MKKQLALAIVLATASFAVTAGELSYTYVEAGFGRTNVEVDANVDDIEADGYFLQGAVELGDSFHLFGGYQSARDNDYLLDGIDVDLTQAQLGIGYHHSVSDSADFLAEISYLNREVEVDGFGFSGSEDADAYRASFGFRGALSDNFEGQIKVNYTEGTDGGSAFTPSFGAQWKFNQTWGLVGEAEFGEDSETYLIGVRASF